MIVEIELNLVSERGETEHVQGSCTWAVTIRREKTGVVETIATRDFYCPKHAFLVEQAISSWLNKHLPRMIGEEVNPATPAR